MLEAEDDKMKLPQGVGIPRLEINQTTGSLQIVGNGTQDNAVFLQDAQESIYNLNGVMVKQTLNDAVRMSNNITTVEDNVVKTQQVIAAKVINDYLLD